jgi:hypothetical protein
VTRKVSQSLFAICTTAVVYFFLLPGAYAPVFERIQRRPNHIPDYERLRYPDYERLRYEKLRSELQGARDEMWRSRPSNERAISEALEPPKTDFRPLTKIIETSRSLDRTKFEKYLSALETKEGTLPSGVSKKDVEEFVASFQIPNFKISDERAVTYLWSAPEISGQSMVKAETDWSGGTTKTAFISTENLEDKNNSDALQGGVLKKVAKPQKGQPPTTIVIPRDDPLAAHMVAKMVRSEDFAVRQASSPESFAFNMMRLAKRPHSQRVKIFDFSPQSPEALAEMGFPPEELGQWQEMSKKLQETVRDHSNGDEAVAPRDLDEFFRALKNDQGAVVILYAHCDGNNIMLHVGDQIVTLTPELLRENLGPKFGETWVPPVVLLNCEASGAPASMFLDANAPIVYASGDKIGLDEAHDFIADILDRVHNKKSDALDAVVEAIKSKGPAGVGPMSKGSQPGSRM